MCVHFFNFDHLGITLQISDHIWAQNFVLLLSLSLHSSSHTFKLLSMTSYGGELLLDSTSPWSDISNHLSSFSIPLSWSSRSQGLHWWRRSKAYKLHMELRHIFLDVFVVWVGNFLVQLNNENLLYSLLMESKVPNIVCYCFLIRQWL